MTLEHLGDGPKDAGPVVHVEVEVVAGQQLVDGPDGASNQADEAGVGALAQVGRGIDQITQNRGAGGITASTAASVQRHGPGACRTA